MAGSPEPHLRQSAVRADKERIDVAIIDHLPSWDIRVSREFPRRVTRAGSQRLVGELGRIRKDPRPDFCSRHMQAKRNPGCLDRSSTRNFPARSPSKREEPDPGGAADADGEGSNHPTAVMHDVVAPESQDRQAPACGVDR